MHEITLPRSVVMVETILSVTACSLGSTGATTAGAISFGATVAAAHPTLATSASNTRTMITLLLMMYLLPHAWGSLGCCCRGVCKFLCCHTRDIWGQLQTHHSNVSG